MLSSLLLLLLLLLLSSLLLLLSSAQGACVLTRQHQHWQSPAPAFSCDAKDNKKNKKYRVARRGMA